MVKLQGIKYIFSMLVVVLILGVFPSKAKDKYRSVRSDGIQLELADSVLSYADSFLGTRYRRGTASKNGFDCSGFTSYVFSKFGYDLNRSSKGQFYEGDPINANLLLPGDLVFFGGSKSRKTVGHVGIVVSVSESGFKFIHASRNGVRVSKYPQEKYYSNRYIGARRILPLKAQEDNGESFFEEMITKIETGVSLLKLPPPINPKKYSFNIDLDFLNSVE